ncbi:hypothetical protein GUJ93_ZPchr0012g22090 [Zizania palustris]|uniref:Uncharacterized protein n=1 Tax=Zizania palustris TaxID=103762 RepID=A0A8J5WPV1_ZIZPA|nr:hypothetical protein GUJ93_ZPchr0012g22090 [Zizania palustris]
MHGARSLAARGHRWPDGVQLDCLTLLTDPPWLHVNENDACMCKNCTSGRMPHQISLHSLHQLVANVMVAFLRFYTVGTKEHSDAHPLAQTDEEDKQWTQGFGN